MDGRTSRSLKPVLLVVLVLVLSSAFATTCPSCGAQNPDDAVFCGKCRASLTREVRVPSVVGKDRDEAIAILRSAECGVRPIDSTSDATPGKVLRQSRTGTYRVGADTKPTITIWVSASFPEPQWLRKIKDWTGWPAQGKSVAGISIGDSASTVRNMLGDPVRDSGGSWYYPHGEDSLRVVFEPGQADTIVDTVCVSMSASLRQSLTTPFGYILKALAAKEPEESDSLHKAYPEYGITLQLRSDTLDTVVVGFSIYAARTEAPWVAALKKNWPSFMALTPASLSHFTPDIVRQLFGQPQHEEPTAMVYEDHGSQFVFSIVGGEIDSISLFPTKPLWDSLPGFKTTGEAERVFGKPASHESLAGREKLAYVVSGLDLIFDSGVLSSMNWYYPEYHDMVLIPAGRFLLGTSRSDVNRMRDRENHPEWGRFDFGAEMLSKEVYLDSFYIDRFEVSNRQYKKFLRATGYRMQGDSSWIFRRGKEDYPAAGVTWRDADTFAKWAGKRLPTEIEWEKAARCTLGFWFPWGCSSSDAPARANYRQSDTTRGPRASVPVASLQMGASLYGVYNMAGNVAEWCCNPYSREYYQKVPLTNPKGIENVRSDSFTSVRGGSFQSSLFEIRATYRLGLPKTAARGDLGFRCVKDIK